MDQTSPSAGRGERRSLSKSRAKLIKQGVDSMSLAELLLILIRANRSGEAASDAATTIASRFENRIEGLLDCGPDELKQICPIVTSAGYTQIMAGIELGRRISLAQITRQVSSLRITSTCDAVDFCRHRFWRLASDGLQEQFHIVTLDTKHKPIQTHCITVGTLDASLVHPREVFRPAIRDAAAAILLVHNHPSGDPTPSREDHRVTQQLTSAGQLLGIEVLDHIVVAREACLSIREHPGGDASLSLRSLRANEFAAGR